jgi:hypothetical protein
MKLFVVFALAMFATVQAGWFDDTKDWLSKLLIEILTDCNLFLGGAVDTAGDLATNAKDKVVEGASTAGQWTKEKASDAGVWAKDTGTKVVDGAKQITLDDIVNGAKNAGQKVGDTATGVYNKISGQDDN